MSKSTKIMKTDYSLTSDSSLTELYASTITPFWENKVQKRHFTGVGNLSLFTATAVAPQSKGTIVLSTGRTEGAIKYKELFYNLVQNGYSVYAMDHRGQGQSGRISENPDKGHVEDYQDYVDDLRTFYKDIVEKESEHPPILLCHSMGCTIGAKYNLTYPEDFTKAIYASPMFAINSPIPVWLAKAIVNIELAINRLFSDQPWYFLGQGDHKQGHFADNVVTHSEARFNLSNQDLNDVDAQLGGITNQWLRASIIAMNDIESNAHLLSQKTLLLQAGADTVVDNRQQDLISRKIPNCHLVTIDGARHELLLERDEYRNLAMQNIFSFIESD